MPLEISTEEIDDGMAKILAVYKHTTSEVHGDVCPKKNKRETRSLPLSVYRPGRARTVLPISSAHRPLPYMITFTKHDSQPWQPNSFAARHLRLAQPSPPSHCRPILTWSTRRFESVAGANQPKMRHGLLNDDGI